MKDRHWIVAATGTLIAMGAFLGVAARSNGAAVEPDVYTSGHFAINVAASASGVLHSVEGEGVRAEVVSLHPDISQTFCNMAIQFLDGQGAVLYTKDVNVSPGETQSLELPSQQLPNGGAFRVTFQGLDKAKNGKPRPCLAIPSVHVYDKTLGTTVYYLPIVTG